MIKLVNVNSIKPSTYNPRSVDEKRLELVGLSLRKLGFLLQLFINSDEIISGHQRHFVYKNKLKGKLIPVTNIIIDSLEKKKALNVVFNRATNDFQRKDTSSSVNNKLSAIDVIELSKNIPDIKPDTPEFYPCMNTVKVPINKLLTANKGKWSIYSRNLANTLYQKKIEMPVIARNDFTIINGIGRLQVYAEKKFQTVDVVFISNKQSDFAKAMLNYLSMDFDIHNKYSDLLRYNSFRRAVTNRQGLGKGFFIECFGKLSCKEFEFNSQFNINKWKGYYGTKVLDFGAGHLTDTEILRNINVDVTPFEPYRIKSGTNYIDKINSLKLVDDFLLKVKNKFHWDSIFISSVLNSVPFEKDREFIITILAACCFEKSTVYAWIMSKRSHTFNNMISESLNEKFSKTIQFQLDYEPGIILGDFSGKPKVQKFHDVDEVKKLFLTSFENVKIKLIQESFSVVASKPKLNLSKLKEAIEFEFNLPYPDNSRMNRVDKAKKSFSKRLGISL